MHTSHLKLNLKCEKNPLLDKWYRKWSLAYRYGLKHSEQMQSSAGNIHS